MSYRNCAEKLSQTTGLSISHAAVWNVIQALGDKLVHDEKELVETGKKEDLRGGAEKFLYYLKKRMAFGLIYREKIVQEETIPRRK